MRRFGLGQVFSAYGDRQDEHEDDDDDFIDARLSPYHRSCTGQG